MKLYSSNETNKTSTQTITTSDSITTYFASQSNPIELLGNTTQTGTPTPSTPVEIENVTGRQEIDVVGKNLFSGNYSQFDSTGGTGTTYGYFALPTSNEKYTLTLIAKNNFTGTATTYIGFSANGGNATGGIKWAMLDGKAVTKGETITIDNVYSGGYYNFVSIYSNSSTTLETFTNNFYIQLEKDEETSYEPYINNTYEIDLNKSKKRRTSNLYNYKNTTQVSSGITTDNDGWITATFDNSSGTSPATLYYYTKNLDLEYNTEYAIFLETKGINITNGGWSLGAATYELDNGQFDFNCGIGHSDGESNHTYRFWNRTKRQNQGGYVNGLGTRISFWPGATGSITFRISVIKNMNITTNTFKYEPFEKYNYIDFDSLYPFTSNTTITKYPVSNTIRVSNTATPCYGSYFNITNVEPNTDYILTYNFSSISNGYNKVEIWQDISLPNQPIASAINQNQIKFNSGNHTSFIILFYGSNNAVGESEYSNINLTQYIELNKINNYQDRIFKSKGYNLFDEQYELGTINYTTGELENSTTIIRTKNYQTIKPSTQYTIKVPNEVTGIIFYYYNNDTFIVANQPTIPQNKTITFTTNANANKVKWRFNSNYTTLNNQTMLNKGTTALSYEPYGEPSWYIEKQIGKLVFDGSESWYKAVTGTNTNLYYTQLTYISADVLSQYFTRNDNLYSEDVEGMRGVTSNNRMWFRISNTTASDATAFKTWLSTHNTIVYYVLSTPTYTKIENEELVNQLESVLNLYKGINNITITSSNLTPQLKVEFKDGFTHNGLGIITDVLEANVTEQINGDYYLDFRVAINNKLADDLTYNNIISCKVADGTEQFFRIKRVVKTFTEIQIYATHIFYDLIDNVLDNVAPTGLTCADYGRWLLSHTNYWTPFTFNSDMLSWSSGRYVRKNVVESMIGNIDNSMLVKFGGEIVRDNFDIALNYSRGNDNGVILRVGKNIKQIEITTDIDNMATRIIPVGFDGLMIPEKYIDSPLINDYPQPKMAVVEFSDIKYEPLEEGVTPSEDDGTYHILSEAEQALRDRVYALYNNGADKPSVNVKVDWLELSKTNQYSQYSDLEKVNIGDRITISILGENYKSEVIKTTYNSLTDMIESFEIGSISGSIVNAVNGNTQTIQNFSPSEILSSAAANANQQLINVLGGTYGYVGGFKIFSDKLACEYYPPADFTQTDLTKLSNYLLDPVSNPLTPEEYELYDLKKDGVLNTHDLLLMDRLIQSGITTTNPLVYSMETGSNILDGGIKITDGNGNNIIQVGLAGYEYKGENITPDVYDVGDTYFIYNYQAGGMITSSTTRVFFSIPINGVVKNGTPRVSNAEVVLRGISGYLNASEANGTITHNKSGYTWNVSDEGDHFNIYILKSSAYTNVSNNTPVSVSIHSLEITFE